MGKRSKTLAGANLDLQEIEPLTKNQLRAFESDNNMVLHGVAGTGKTFISCYLAFDDMIKGTYDKLVLIRSAVPTRDIGFLPGNEKEKASVYEEPYKDICIELFQRGDAYQILKTKGIVHFMTTSFIRVKASYRKLCACMALFCCTKQVFRSSWKICPCAAAI